jgi:hypothetical protein
MATAIFTKAILDLICRHVEACYTLGEVSVMATTSITANGAGTKPFGKNGKLSSAKKLLKKHNAKEIVAMFTATRLAAIFNDNQSHL